MMTSLNAFRDEAGAFLDAIGKTEDDATILSLLNEEVAQLNLSFQDESCRQHQLYDVLFLVFELAARHNLDMDAEWENGRITKQTKYHHYSSDVREGSIDEPATT